MGIGVIFNLIPNEMPRKWFIFYMFNIIVHI